MARDPRERVEQERVQRRREAQGARVDADRVVDLRRRRQAEQVLEVPRGGEAQPSAQRRTTSERSQEAGRREELDELRRRKGGDGGRVDADRVLEQGRLQRRQATEGAARPAGRLEAGEARRATVPDAGGRPETEGEASRQKRAQIVDEMMAAERRASLGRRSKERPLEFLDTQRFDAELAARGLSGDEQERVLGFHDPRDGRTRVRDQGETGVTAVHEKHHQLSAGQVPELEEGIAEHRARQKVGPVGELHSYGPHGEREPRPEVYEARNRIASKLEAAVGKENVDAAYFGGDEQRLRRATDEYFGKGTYDRATEFLRDGHDEAAEKLLRPGAPKSRRGS